MVLIRKAFSLVSSEIFGLLGSLTDKQTLFGEERGRSQHHFISAETQPQLGLGDIQPYWHFHDDKAKAVDLFDFL